MSGASNNGIESVTKAVTILQAFTPLQTTLSVRQLVERTGIPRSTTHELCRTLREAGLLQHLPNRGYQLGPALVGLGGQVIDRTGLVTAAEGVLSNLPRRAGLEAHLGQYVDGWIVYLDRELGPMPRPMRNRVGLRAPAFQTGCGKAALSLLDPADQQEAVARCCACEHIKPPDSTALTEELERGRRQGYLLSDDFQPGRISLAVPIVDGDDHPVGAVSVAGTSDQFTRQFVNEFAVHVQEVARVISHRLTDRVSAFRAAASLR